MATLKPTGTGTSYVFGSGVLQWRHTRTRTLSAPLNRESTTLLSLHPHRGHTQWLVPFDSAANALNDFGGSQDWHLPVVFNAASSKRREPLD